MKKLDLGKSGLLGSQAALGCMRMAGLNDKEAAEVIQASLAAGINFFDHADIYGGGTSEEIFARGMKAAGISREDVVLQSKCGIRKGFFDFSKEHILDSVDGILKRLDTDYIDLLALHRPDTLVEPEEVAAAFDLLHKSGKVRHFGVSNQTPGQIAFLQKHLDQKLIVNQLQFSIMHTGMIDAGLNANMTNPGSVDHDGGILDYCRLNDITIQAWSPYQFGFFDGVFLDNEKFPLLNAKIDEVAAKYGVSNTAIATAWINRHPAGIQTIVGTMSPSRIKQVAEAQNVALTREEWYDIYRAAGNILP